MFSLDTKQWETVASGLLSSVAKKEAAQDSREDKTTRPDPKTPVDFGFGRRPNISFLNQYLQRPVADVGIGRKRPARQKVC